MTPRRYDLGKRADSVAETQRRILEATFKLHNEQGVAATTIPEVARRADVALGTVYKHFPTVDALVTACGGHVMALIKPPGPDTFVGVEALPDRISKLVHELFAMYERGARQIAVARCEQDEVPALKAFVQQDARGHEQLLRLALGRDRLAAPELRAVLALTDFYIWKAFSEKRVPKQQAAEIITAAVLAKITGATARKGTTQ